MGMTGSDLYGTPRTVQPTGSAATTPAEPGSNTRTEARGGTGDPVNWLVGMIGLAILLIATVRFEFSVTA